MAEAKSVRIDGDLVAAAEAAAMAGHRSTAEQVNYWAAVGRRIIAATGVDQGRMDAVVAGTGQFDDLTAEERVIAHARIDVTIEQAVTRTPLAEHARADGITTVTVDESGQLVWTSPDGTISHG
ncbi:hypothetical protein DVS28_b0341 (plasmid) [Euzebya pacifica]|uniref:ParD-like antitoxin of type II toxin-antitoxin system n=1 Tax=Euzebya pacifica TaxID=1608957 RepID=A0A346Y6L4_9ACTN|nr:hypothetical protein [Euzebya pacifica]AXV10111.1 hypothetical protein DVS28_b0341 [Euzebya pacifica]